MQRNLYSAVAARWETPDKVSPKPVKVGLVYNEVRVGGRRAIEYYNREDLPAGRRWKVGVCRYHNSI
jgi:hypothetical protein